MSKAIDKAAGAERETKPWLTRNREGVFAGDGGETTATGGNLQCPDCLKWKFAPDYCKCPRDNGAQTPEAARWQGWGTALKPGWEIIVVARKPLIGTVAANILQYGTGALNIDATRIAHGDDVDLTTRQRQQHFTDNGWTVADKDIPMYKPGGRWPANVVLDEDAAAELDQQSGDVSSSHNAVESIGAEGTGKIGPIGLKQGRAQPGINTYSDRGGASRFFYTAKASTDERIRHNGTGHPTVKPLSLMRWLVKLVTQPGGVVLDPFAGSGTTVEACILEGFRCIAVERETPYLPLITQRINRRLDPVAYLEASGDDLGLFGEIA